MNTLEFHRHGGTADDMFAADLPPVAIATSQPSPSIVRQILTIVRRRKWILLGSVAFCLVLGLVVTLLMTPKYTAATTVEIQRETQSITDVDGAKQGSGGFSDQEFYQTQYGLLASKALAERVATDLRLYENVQFLQMAKIGGSDWFSGNRMSATAPPRNDRIAAVGGYLLQKIEVVPERMSRLVVIKYTSPDRDIAKRVADMWATDFIQVTLERRYEATTYARKFLEQRLGQLRSRIDESELRLVRYARSEGIVNLPSVGTVGSANNERSLAADDLVSLNNELASATADRIREESRRGGSGGPAGETMQNGLLSTLRQRRAELAADYARLMVQFAPDYPPAKALREQRKQIDASIEREQARVTGALTENYTAAVSRERALRERVSALKSGVLDFRQRSIQYNILQRDVDTNRQLYDALLQRYKEIGVAGGVGVNNISIVDTAELPGAPSSPRLLLNMLAALFAGIALGALAALLLEQLDQGIVDPGEVEGTFGTPLLGTIPATTDHSVLEAFTDRKSALSEAYVSLQTNLAFTTTHGLPRVIGVTSSQASEGKSTTSYALAHSIARSGHRVVLVDADMRSPSVHHWFDVANTVGLSNYLTGNDSLNEMVQPTRFERMSFMTAGPQPPSAPELLSGERMDEFLEALLAKFDHVIIDAPPVMGLADAPLIASRVEGTLFVIESGRTHREMARVSLGRLRAANAALLGIVLTKFDARRSSYGYGYEYGYEYGATTKKA